MELGVKLKQEVVHLDLPTTRAGAPRMQSMAIRQCATVLTLGLAMLTSTRLSLMLDQLAVNELATRQLARRHAHLIDLLTTEDASDRLNVRQVGPRLSEVLEDDPHDTGQRDCEKPAHNPPQEHPCPQRGED